VPGVEVDKRGHRLPDVVVAGIRRPVGDTTCAYYKRKKAAGYEPPSPKPLALPHPQPLQLAALRRVIFFFVLDESLDEIRDGARVSHRVAEDVRVPYEVGVVSGYEKLPGIISHQRQEALVSIRANAWRSSAVLKSLCSSLSF